MIAVLIAALLAQLDAGVAAPPAPAASPPGIDAERVAEIQAALQATKVDAWLLTDFRRSDPIALGVLNLDNRAEGFGSRRWFYLFPARGQPQKLLHAIEPTMLDAVPGAASLYSS